MIAVDTNVLVRYVTNDNPDEARRAMEVLGGSSPVLVTHTVLLEFEWVLRSAYELPRDRTQAAMLHVLGLPTVTIERPERVAQALRWHDGGMDFADALHLSLAHDADDFVTFDRRLASRAASDGLRVRLL